MSTTAPNRAPVAEPEPVAVSWLWGVLACVVVSVLGMVTGTILAAVVITGILWARAVPSGPITAPGAEASPAPAGRPVGPLEPSVGRFTARQVCDEHDRLEGKVVEVVGLVLTTDPGMVYLGKRTPRVGVVEGGGAEAADRLQEAALDTPYGVVGLLRAGQRLPQEDVRVVLRGRVGKLDDWIPLTDAVVVAVEP